MPVARPSGTNHRLRWIGMRMPLSAGVGPGAAAPPAGPPSHNASATVAATATRPASTATPSPAPMPMSPLAQGLNARTPVACCRWLTCWWDRAATGSAQNPTDPVGPGQDAAGAGLVVAAQHQPGHRVVVAERRADQVGGGGGDRVGEPA